MGFLELGDIEGGEGFRTAEGRDFARAGASPVIFESGIGDEAGGDDEGEKEEEPGFGVEIKKRNSPPLAGGAIPNLAYSVAGCSSARGGIIG